MGVPTANAPVSQQQRPARRLFRSGVWCGYLAALAVVSIVFGIPTDRIYQAAWIMVGIAAFNPYRPWREHVRILIDWVPLIAALVVYDHTRGIADKLGMPVRVEELVSAESWLFGGTIPTVWLQQQLMTGDQRPWWSILTGIVYTSHFIVPWLVAAIFYVQSRGRWSKYMRRIVLLSYLGLLTYILVPAAPPWYASREGVIPEDVGRVSGFGFGMVSFDTSADWLEAQGNLVAALPSLHAAFSLMVTVALWSYAPKWFRVILALYPPAMAFTLIYGGEHYTVDVLLGWAYVGVTILLARAWEKRRPPPPDEPREPPVADTKSTTDGVRDGVNRPPTSRAG
ncbi:phosphatase PAP2 family protein [Nocardia cyriacigeorgica]|uniref:PAP2 superfamily n=1 Tax=Nocardia cyriacigeorgica TaxID=135487 RepID=A0A4U8WFS4_9NOCA|nr:phosphatase PAP2 family protein [Nocardia cyriacigeorgica]VFB00779.1 PAP2 superfamily [Nocardia cyriacigeorgica]